MAIARNTQRNKLGMYRNDFPRRAHLIALILFLSSGNLLKAQVTHQVVVNPIQVCNDLGTVCANPQRELYLAETDKIWRQAGIDVYFLDWQVMNSTTHLSGASLGAISSAPGNQRLGGEILNMWFVQQIEESSSFGRAFRPGRSIMIADSVFSYAGGAGRRDTIAHEIGHNLNLPHIAGDFPLNLMESGGIRDAATSLGQIFPDGEQRDQLTEAQIATALDRRSVEPLSISVPGDASLDGLVDETDIGLFVAGWKHTHPDLNVSWPKGDFSLDGTTDLADAFILHEALLENGQSGFDFSLLGGGQVPEPSSFVLAVWLLLGWQYRGDSRHLRSCPKQQKTT